MATPTPFVKSERLQKLPPYPFAEIDKKKKAAIAAGRDVINLGVGDPDRPTPEPIIKSLQQNVENPAFHQYALDQGAPELRLSIAAFCKRRYGLTLDPDTEILPLIGSKEGIAHFPLAVLNPGDISLVPDPCYPVYRSSSMFAGADVYTMPLEPSLGFRPDLDAIPSDVYALARLMFLNYPNNPTGGTVDLPFLQKVVDLAGTHGFSSPLRTCRIQRDVLRQAGAEHPRNPRGEGRGDRVPQPVEDVQHDGLAGRLLRIGGRQGASSPRLASRSSANVDSGIFTAIQFAGKTALDQYDDLTPPIRALYKERRDAFVGGMRKLGWDVPTADATFYVWMPCPQGYTSAELCTKLLDEANVGDDSVGSDSDAPPTVTSAAALTVETPRLLEAVDRIGKLKL